MYAVGDMVKYVYNYDRLELNEDDLLEELKELDGKIGKVVKVNDFHDYDFPNYVSFIDFDMAGSAFPYSNLDIDGEKVCCFECAMWELELVEPYLIAFEINEEACPTTDLSLLGV